MKHFLILAIGLYLGSSFSSAQIIPVPILEGGTPRTAEEAPFVNKCFESTSLQNTWVFYFSEFGEVLIDHVRKKNGKRKIDFLDKADMNWQWNPLTSRVVADGKIFSTAALLIVGVGYFEANYRWEYADNNFTGLRNTFDLVECSCLNYEEEDGPFRSSITSISANQQNLALKPLHQEGEQISFLIKSETVTGTIISIFEGFNGWAYVVDYDNKKGKTRRKTIDESDLKVP